MNLFHYLLQELRRTVRGCENTSADLSVLFSSIFPSLNFLLDYKSFSQNSSHPFCKISRQYIISSKDTFMLACDRQKRIPVPYLLATPPISSLPPFLLPSPNIWKFKYWARKYYKESARYDTKICFKKIDMRELFRVAAWVAAYFKDLCFCFLHALNISSFIFLNYVLPL